MLLLNKPCCPIACKYCFITEDDIRRERWNNTNKIFGLNKACLFVVWNDFTNKEIWLSKFKSSIHLLYDDIIGATSTTDPFWTKIFDFFKDWNNITKDVARLRVAVTKWPLSDYQISYISEMEKFHITLTITGADALEKVKTKTHLKTIDKLLNHNIDFSILIHPYIEGYSNLKFLKDVKKLGINDVIVKGFRASIHMKYFLNQDMHKIYLNNLGEEILPEHVYDIIKDKYNMDITSLDYIYKFKASKIKPKYNYDYHASILDNVIQASEVFSSDKSMESIKKAVLERRIMFNNI